jgi:hypothetical protein
VKAFLFLGTALLISAGIVLAGNEDLPRTLAELNRWYVEPPTGQNAATIILEATAALRITDADSNSLSLPRIGNVQLPQPDKPIPADMKAAITEFIQRNEPALGLFGQAAQFQQSRYPIDLNQGKSVLLPHLLKLKQAAKILELSSVSHAVAGQSGEAGDDLLTSFALARSLESEPVLISQLVRVACDSIAVDALEQILNRITLSTHTLDQLQDSLRQYEAREAMGLGFTRAFVGEQVSDLSAFEMAPDQYLTVPDNATPEERKKFEIEIMETMKMDRNYCQTTFDRALALRSRPFPGRLSQDVFAEAEIAATNKNLRLSCLFFAALDAIAPKEAGDLANLRLAQTAIALEKFRSDHANRYPDALTELTPNYLPSVPADPFDGKPLRYRKTGEGYVLYSIGRNLKDDGGKPGHGMEGDIVFSVISPPPAS